MQIFLQKSRIASGTIDIEKDGGKNATEGNNPHTMRDNRRNGQTKRNGLKRGGGKRGRMYEGRRKQMVEGSLRFFAEGGGAWRRDKYFFES